MTSSMTSQGDLKVGLYTHVKGRLDTGTNCKGNVSSIHANIVMVFRGYICLKKISINNNFEDQRSEVNVTGLLDDLGTKTALILSIVGLSRWNNNLNVRNSHSYFAMATKIRFHFHFPRPPDFAFSGGWLLNLKFKFGCRMISNLAKIIKCN